MNTEFNVGDTVVLKSGSPKMVINSISSPLPHHAHDNGPNAETYYNLSYYNILSGNIGACSTTKHALKYPEEIKIPDQI